MRFYQKSNVILYLSSNKLRLRDIECLLYAYCRQGFREIQTDFSLNVLAERRFIKKLEELYSLKLSNASEVETNRFSENQKPYYVSIKLEFEKSPRSYTPNIHKILELFESQQSTFFETYRAEEFKIELIKKENSKFVDKSNVELQTMNSSVVPLVKFSDPVVCNKSILLDRDGVINIDHGYVGNYKDIEYIDGIFDFLKKISDLDYRIFIVTNQSGIGRGYYSEYDFWNLSSQMLNKFLDYNISIDYIYYSPYYSMSDFPEYRRNSSYRKPKIGLFNRMQRMWKIDVENSILIGDKSSDIQFAKNVGLKSFLFPNTPFSKILDHLDVS